MLATVAKHAAACAKMTEVHVSSTLMGWSYGREFMRVNAPPCSVLALNPGLDCAKLKPGQLVCTGTGGAPTATCGNRCGDLGFKQAGVISAHTHVCM